MVDSDQSKLPDLRIPQYLGRVLNGHGSPVGTCFQVVPTLLITAWHVLADVNLAEVGSSVVIDALSGGQTIDARVACLDETHDLAAIRTTAPLPASVELGNTDSVTLREKISVTGYGVVENDPVGYRYLIATGRWSGTTLRNDGVRLGCMTAQRVIRGMSGAPVILDAEGTAIGVVSGRYNSGDGWLRDNVWIAHTEDIAHLLTGTASINIRKRSLSSAPSKIAVGNRPVNSTPAIRWVHTEATIDHFSGRKEELNSLDRWINSGEVRLIGVTAWGGAGKTVLVTEFLQQFDFTNGRQFAGLFGWSFYEDPVAENWGRTFLSWVTTTFDLRPKNSEMPTQILEVLGALPLIMVLDGLEILQDGPNGSSFGRLLDGALRAVLTGHCLMDNKSLIVLTSRFPFSDLEHFDGTAARMLDVPPLALDDGVKLLKRGGASWLTAKELADLVRLVDGHALAVATLAAVLRQHVPTSDLLVLQQELASANRTDARVSKVLRFYAGRLSESDRMLVAIVSLFQQPIQAQTILSLGSHSSLKKGLAGWTIEDVEVASRQRLAGLVSWRSDGYVSAHPLVRDVFRSMVLSGQTAHLVSEVTLRSMPTGPVRSAEEAQRIVEIIELLLESGEWKAAQELYRSRTKNGRVWMRLPAARLGLRCAMAFTQTGKTQPGKTSAPLSEQQFGFFANEVGLFALQTGDIKSAERFLRKSILHYRSVDTSDAEAITLRNLSRCHIYRGDAPQAKSTALDALRLAKRIRNPNRIRNARACLAYAMDLNGETKNALDEFTKANEIQASIDGRQLYSVDGAWWADLLLRIGQPSAARRIGIENLQICQSYDWNADKARYHRLLARCDLSVGNIKDAVVHLELAMHIFRSGEYLFELAETLPDLAEYHRRVGELDQAERCCTEAIATLASPRELLPTLARGLAARAMVKTDLYTHTGHESDLAAARDDAIHCMRIATKIKRLPWMELCGLEASTFIDAASGADNGWRRLRDRQSARLIGKDHCIELRA
jgi:tetratricopeptide (TPR) repeat protein